MEQQTEPSFKPLVLAVTTKVEGGYMATVYHTITHPDGKKQIDEIARTSAPVPDVDMLHAMMREQFPDLRSPDMEGEDE